jgi:hypothetical protein
MHKSLSVAALFIVLTPTVMLAQSVMFASPPIEPNTPESVRVQPRGRAFMPNSSEDAAVQERLSRFNATQQLLDTKLDRRLTICRRC